MTDKQTVLEMVNRFPDDASLREIIVALQSLAAGANEESFNGSTALSAAKPRRARLPGSHTGEFVVPEDFDDPLPEDIQVAFEGR